MKKNKKIKTKKRKRKCITHHLLLIICKFNPWRILNALPVLTPRSHESAGAKTLISLNRSATILTGRCCHWQAKDSFSPANASVEPLALVAEQRGVECVGSELESWFAEEHDLALPEASSRKKEG